MTRTAVANSRRSVFGLLAVAAMVAGLIVPSSAPVAAAPTAPVAAAPTAPLAAAAATPPTSVVLRSPALAVTVDPAFPRVEQYQTPGGAVLYGNEDTLQSVSINGTAYTPTVTGKQTAGTASYHLAIDPLKVTLDATLSVSGSVLTFAITAIDDPGKVVETIDIPGMNLVSIRSTQPGAALAGAGFSVDPKKSSDSFAKVADLPPDAAPVGKSYAFLSTDQLAAGVETNTITEPLRLAEQTVQHDGYRRTGLWSKPWVWREHDTKSTTALPWAKVVVTGDANHDGVVNWQDGADAFRQIMVNSPGYQDTKDRVVPYISFNFASLAGQPFLKALDNVKKVSLLTDDLGQNVLLKGYQSEGHDSAHPDYGGHYNTRAGGLADMKTLIHDGAAYHATFGVHVNSTEAYPEAHNFSWTLANPNSKCWGWLDQSYCDNRHSDVSSGALAKRFALLKQQVPDPNLSYIYVDVSTGSGWDAWKLAQVIHGDGWQTFTEFPSDWERESLWSHWANDPTYGAGGSIRGVNSQIIRFLRNDQKDVFSPDQMLANAQLADFEGWQGRVDLNKALQIVWQDDLPAKFQQHYQITRWTDSEVDFTGGVKLVKDGSNVVMSQHGRTLMTGGAYLLPWSDKSDPSHPTKLYHYTPTAGATSWQLPAQWSGVRSLAMYKLTQTGRTKVATLPVRGGSVLITAEAKTGYVLEPANSTSRGPQASTVDFGQGALVADPGFDSHSFRHWKSTGPVAITDDANGQSYLHTTGSGSAQVAQKIRGLQPGHTYSASAWVR